MKKISVFFMAVALVSLSVLVVPQPVKSKDFVDCLSCCGLRPNKDGDLDAWYVCMHECQIAANQGSPWECSVH